MQDHVPSRDLQSKPRDRVSDAARLEAAVLELARLLARQVARELSVEQNAEQESDDAQEDG